MITRVLAEADVETFRRFRLEALRESPLSFGGSAESEAALSPDEWVRRLCPERGAVYGCFDSSDALVATLGVYVLEDDDERAGPWLWTMYVQPRVRRRGIARQLLQWVLDDLLARGERRPLRLHVTNASASAKALYESFGFEVSRQEFDVPWHSGQTVHRAEMILRRAGENLNSGTAPMVTLLRITPLIPAGDDIEYGIRFFTEELGFAVTWQAGNMAGVRRGEVEFNLVQNSTVAWAENASASIGVNDLTALYAEYRTTSAQVGPLELKSWGRREFHMILPSGVCLQFYQVAE